MGRIGEFGMLGDAGERGEPGLPGEPVSHEVNTWKSLSLLIIYESLLSTASLASVYCLFLS